MAERAEFGIHSVEKAIAILRAFDHEQPELGVTELSARLGVHKSTVSRLLTTLEAGGLVERDPATRRYRLGVELIALAGLVMRHADLRGAARPALESLAERCRETANLAIYHAGMAMNIEQFLPADRQIRDIGWVGRRTPLHATSVGKVLLAHLSPEQAQHVIGVLELPALTSHTITDWPTLRGELEAVRRQGYALGLEELEIGLNSVAAPVRDHSGAVIAAISVSGPSYRVSRAEAPALAGRVVETAASVSRALGYDANRLGD